MVRKLLEMLENKSNEIAEKEPTKSNLAKACGLGMLEGMIDGAFIVGALAFLAGIFGKKPEKK